MVTSLRVEGRLDGATNLRSWKTRILFIFEKNEIQDCVKTTVLELEKDEVKTTKNKNEEKVKRILVDIFKYHMIPHIAKMKNAKKIYDALKSLFENNNCSRKLVLRNQFCGIRMWRYDTIYTYFMKVS